MSEQEDVDKLANSLKSSGLAMSWIDALNKAKAILGFGGKPTSIKIDGPKEEHKAKVEDIIKEVDKEIEQMKQIDQKIEPEAEKIIQPKMQQEELSKFEDPNFNIADSNFKVEDLVKAAEEPEIFTNDPETLEKEKQGEKMVDPEEDSIIMTNEEMEQENEEEKDEDAEEENYGLNQEG